MHNYTPKYTSDFQNNIVKLLHKKDKRILRKEIEIILHNPYKAADKIEGVKDPVLWRKWVCGAKFRAMYEIKETSKEVIFYVLRPKNKQTYRF